MKKVFTLYFDSNYFYWAPLLCESIAFHEPDCYIFAHAVNCSNEQLQKLHSIEQVCVVAHRFDCDPKIEMAWKMIEAKAGFLLTSIASAPEALHILMDVDMLMVKPLKELTKLMPKYDMAGLVVNKKKIAGGFLAVNGASRKAKELLTEWDNYLMDGTYFYNKDQPSLAELYNRYITKNFKWLDLDRRYLDHQEKKDALIYSAHKLEFGTKEERFEHYKKVLEGLKKNVS